jgi:hypothetical protein
MAGMEADFASLRAARRKQLPVSVDRSSLPPGGSAAPAAPGHRRAATLSISAVVACAKSPVGQLRDELVPTCIDAGSQIAHFTSGFVRAKHRPSRAV